MAKDSKLKKKVKKKVEAGVAHIKATFNNTKITITDLQGNVIAWASAGQEFKGSRKCTAYAAQVVAQKAAEKAKDEYGLQKVSVRVKGPGQGRESAVRAIGSVIEINGIEDTTGIPFNGCRPPKERRV